MSGQLITKRRFPRRRLKRPVGILIDGNYSVAPGEEIGEGGLSLFYPDTLATGKQLIVTFGLEDQLHVLRGEVRYTIEKKNDQPNLIGIAFIDISFKFKKLIRRYIGAKTEEELLLEKQERLLANQ